MKYHRKWKACCFIWTNLYRRYIFQNVRQQLAQWFRGKCNKRRQYVSTVSLVYVLENGQWSILWSNFKVYFTFTVIRYATTSVALTPVNIKNRMVECFNRVFFYVSLHKDALWHDCLFVYIFFCFWYFFLNCHFFQCFGSIIR